MKKLKWLGKTALLLAALIVSASCQSTDKISYKTLGEEQVSLFNKAIEGVSIESLEELAEWYLPKDTYAEGNYQYSVSFEEQKGQILLNIVEEGINDDSVAGKMIKMTLVPQEGNQWKVLKIQEAYRCWPNRGHEAWSDQPCL